MFGAAQTVNAMRMKNKCNHTFVEKQKKFCDLWFFFYLLQTSEGLVTAFTVGRVLPACPPR